MALKDTILSSSAVYLFGREVEDLKIEQPDFEERPVRRGGNRFIQQQLEQEDARLARIYAFAFEGTFYDLSRPTVFLVHGKGDDPDWPTPSGFARLSRAPSDPDHTGLHSQTGAFAETMRVWVYDKGDFTMRLDVDAGTVESVLLNMEMIARDARSQSSGMMARSSGMMARSSGMMARSSGMMARRSGGSDAD
jgi:hypothetical protein